MSPQESTRSSAAVPAPASKAPRALASFQHRNYRLWFTGQLVSLAGTWMQSIAQGWLVYQISHSEFALGLVGFASAIPTLLITPWGGVIADRVPKRTLLVITQVCSMLLALILSILAFAGVVEVWHVVVLAALLGAVNAIDAPTRQAFVVEMVGRGELTNAIALNSMMFNGARVIGPAIGGLLLAAVGAGWCFFLNGVSFLAVIVGLLLMRIQPVERRPATQRPWQQLKDGLRYATSRPDIVGLLALASIFGLFGMAYTSLLPAFVDKVYSAGPSAYGLLNTAIGLGAVLGAFTIAQFVDRARRGTWLFYANLGFSSLLIVFAFLTSFPLALLGGFGLGVCFMIQNTTINTLLQTRVDDAMRGRVLSLYTLSFFGLAPFGNLMAGSLAQVWTLQGTVALGAGMTLLLSMLVFFFFPRVRKIE
jgi:MFS family permease